ncbi:hypothetical protein AMATHDRAFT_83004 [Amanita thiersii Skay4041]|uniref:Uncharacterized protein n=1 Tax=Amanita thiersii Skay4041 TaxID=703135 RepID=A0A2A9P0A8_9AGAR|nr:hypothetical protein AMATHDRAFT_83004 [Amanita thiersii Skay4041]
MLISSLSISLGILCGLLASCVQSLGLTIQRKSHIQNQALPEHLKVADHKRPLWLLGVAIFVSSNVLGSLVQIASLPVVILAPLGAVSLLWNAFFARIILGDVFSPWMLLGTLLIAGGAVLIAVFGIVPETRHSLDDLLELFSRPAFIAYFSILGVMLVVCLAFAHIAEYTLIKRSGNLCSSPLQVSFNLPSEHSTWNSSENTATERTPLLKNCPPQSIPNSSPSHKAVSHLLPGKDSDDILIQENNILVLPCGQPVSRTQLLLAVSYAAFSGILSGMCLLFAKSVIELALLTIKGESQFRHWQTYLLVLGLAVFAILQLWYMHKALVFADPTLVCPSAFCFYNLSSIVNGLVYFNQFSLIPSLHLSLIIIGIFILLGGVWIVGIQSDEEQEDDRWLGEGNDSEIENGLVAEEMRRDRDRDGLIESAKRSAGTRAQYGPLPMDRATRSESSASPFRPWFPEDEEGITLGGPSSLSISLQPHEDPRRLASCSGLPLSRGDMNSMHTNEHAQRLHHMKWRSQPNRASTSSHIQLTAAAPAQGLTGSVSTLGTGFQIGLSPISPGFEIIPKTKRRSSILPGLVHYQGSDDGNQRQGRWRRRAMSEAGTGKQKVGTVDPEADQLEEQGTSMIGGEGVPTAAVGKGKNTVTIEGHTQRNSGGKFNWFKRTFRGR